MLSVVRSPCRPGDLYYDETKAFNRCLNNGALRKGSLLSFLNPWSSVRTPFQLCLLAPPVLISAFT